VKKNRTEVGGGGVLDGKVCEKNRTEGGGGGALDGKM
jgi:hypothetical protein